MKKVYLILLSILFLSCATNKIVRWPSDSDEQKSRSLVAINKNSIFKDFLWTTPPVSCRKIENDFKFDNKNYSFEIKEDKLVISKEGITTIFDKLKSDESIYPNTEYLEPTTKVIPKWVPRTTTKVDTVPVSKTRTVPVTTYGANGTSSTSFQTEFYTDFENRVVTETKWVWEMHTEFSYTIPSFDYYKIELDRDTIFYIYEIDSEYYIQNPSYLLCKETNKSFWGDKEVNILFIDSNANGIYLESEDHVLFNIWNPYDPNDSYREISSLMDNRWYYSDILKEDLFLEFTQESGNINISYLNEKFIENENEGTLTINGIKEYKPDIFVNGKKYRIKDGKPFNSEYGNFNIKISTENYLDYLESYAIDEEEPNKVINYQLTDSATLLKIENIFSNNYFVTIKNDRYTKTYYNLKEINIPLGENIIEISVNGFTLSRTINTNISEIIKIDFEGEIKKL